MRYTFSIVSILLGVFINSFQVNAQNEISIQYEPILLLQQDDVLKVEFLVDWRRYNLPKDAEISLAPVLLTDANEVQLPEIVINGKRRYRAVKRDIAINGDQNYIDKYAVLEYSRDYDASIRYIYEIPFEEWMKDAHLNINETLQGCNGCLKEKHKVKLFAKVDLGVPPYYEMDLLTAYIKPEVEEIKMRSESVEAYLDFPVAKTVILPDFRNNPFELNKIESVIKEIYEDKNLTVTQLIIKGYASPEGSVALNNRLSQGRAEALVTYLQGRTNISRSVYKVEFGGEDWVGLVELLQNSNISYKSEILHIIETTYSLDEREQKIQRIDGGRVYKQMLNEMYPRLRRVLCHFDYSVRGFILEESKEIIRTRPQLLSLEEMFVVANSYPIGSKEYIEVFDVAVRMFPDDEIANLNAAAAEIMKKDMDMAEKYLRKVNKTTPEFLNNMGVINLMNENYDAAKDLLQEAANRGLPSAKHNLEELNKKLETIK